MRISDWSSDVCSSDLPSFDRLRVSGEGFRNLLGHDHRLGLEFLVARQTKLGGAKIADHRGAGGAHLVQLFETALVALAPRGHPAFKPMRSEEHTSELQSLMRISYAVFCLKKKTATYIQSK